MIAPGRAETQFEACEIADGGFTIMDLGQFALAQEQPFELWRPVYGTPWNGRQGAFEDFAGKE